MRKLNIVKYFFVEGTLLTYKNYQPCSSCSNQKIWFSHFSGHWKLMGSMGKLYLDRQRWGSQWEPECL